jgi:hypothetical protein
MAWRTHWPSYWPDGDKDKRVLKYMGRKYKWCRKCNEGQGKWMYHFATGHDAWKSRQSTETSTSRSTSCPKSTPAATLAVHSGHLASDDDDDDDDGWKPVRI